MTSHIILWCMFGMLNLTFYLTYFDINIQWLKKITEDIHQESTLELRHIVNWLKDI